MAARRFIDRELLTAVKMNDLSDAIDANTAAAAEAATAAADAKVFTAAGSDAVPRTVQDKLREATSIGDFGAVGDAVTDCSAALIAAAVVGSAIVPSGAFVAAPSAEQVAAVLRALDGIICLGTLAINLPAGTVDFASPLTFRPTAGGDRITINGATPTTASITAGTPSVTANVVSGNRRTYDVTFAVGSATGFSVGDWVIVETTGVSLTYLSYDHTQNGARRRELDGFWQVVGVGASTITARNTSRQSADQFPGAGTIAAATANYTGGTITKIASVLSFTGCSGLTIESDFGGIQNVAIVGNSIGTSTIGLDLDAAASAPTTQRRSVSPYNLGVAGFTGPGANVDGANATASGDRVFVSGCGTHGFRVSGTTATFTNSFASGCGDTVGNGFFATNGATLYCTGSLANGVRNSGFISNRVSTVVAESSHSIGHGNYADEVAGGWADSEGKSYESESGSRLFCGDSVALFCTSIGCYSLAGSMLNGFRCVSSGHLHGHGFYTILGSTMSVRLSVARSNGARGFYAYANSRIEAQDTRAESNVQFDYAAQGASVVWAKDLKNTAAVMSVLPNLGGPNQIITSDTYELGAKLILTRGANVTIASGVIEVTHSAHIIDTEGGAAADDLDTINGGVDGMVLALRCLTDARDIVVKHGTGNIRLSGAVDYTLTVFNDRLLLMYDATALRWQEIGRGDNG